MRRARSADKTPCDRPCPYCGGRPRGFGVKSVPRVIMLERRDERSAKLGCERVRSRFAKP